MNHIKLIDLGVIGYKKAWDFQELLMKNEVEKKINSEDTAETQNHLLICRHPHVYTLGVHGHKENLLLSNEELDSKGIEFHQSNRGGDITYHGPGQLVVYPILDLEKFGSSVKIYLNLVLNPEELRE